MTSSRLPLAQHCDMTIDWFEISYTVIGGLGVFLYGMKGLSESLEALASDYIRRAIGWLTNNRFLAVLVGFVVTGIIQSSSVTTVMAIGFVNAGLMTLTQSIGVVLGANVGTTVTGWILALKIGKYGLLFLAIGLVPFFFLKDYRWRNSGKILIALGLIFLGLNFMSGGFTPLTKDPEFAKSLTFFAADSLPSVLACMAIGCILTFIVQSSSAMLGVTIALATTAAQGSQPVIGLETAVALVIGQNVGTTITAQLAAIGGNVVAKRTALSHSVFNVVGAIAMVPLFVPYIKFIEHAVGPAFDSLSFMYKSQAKQEQFAIIGFEIAAAHTLFNIINVAVFLPFVDHLARLVTWLLPDTGARSRNGLKLLGPLSQISPELAIKEADGQVRQLGIVTAKVLTDTQRYISGEQDDLELRQQILDAEDRGDEIQKDVTVFLTTVLQMQVSPNQSRRAYALIRLADELESIGDYCKAISTYKQKMFREDSKFPASANDEMRTLLSDVIEFFNQSMLVVSNGNLERLHVLLEQAETLRDQANQIRAAHLDRVCSGECQPLAGMAFSDMVVAIRRIKNHTVNLLETMINGEEVAGISLEELDVASGDDAHKLSVGLRPPRSSETSN